MRTDIQKQVGIVTMKESKISALQQQHNDLVQKAAGLIIKEKEVAVLQHDLEKFLDIMSQVDKHLKTLMKQLKTVVTTSQDPVIIEHTQKQIKNIEKIHKDIKKTINNKDSHQDARNCVDSMFDHPSESNYNIDEHQSMALSILRGERLATNPSQTVSERQSLEAAIKNITEKISTSPCVKKGSKRQKTTDVEVFGVNTTMTTAFTNEKNKQATISKK